MALNRQSCLGCVQVSDASQVYHVDSPKRDGEMIQQ
jgi:hypothetical protein